MENTQTRIDRSCVMNLYNSSISDLSPHSIGQWLKVTTEDKYVVVPKSDIMKLRGQIEGLKVWL